MKTTQNSKLKTQNCLTDFHCHILPNLDDGAKTVDESLAMARLLSDAGFTAVHCTPHFIRGHYEPSPAAVRGAVADLQAALDGDGIALTLMPGMEYYLDEFFVGQLDDLLPLGDTKMVLVEAPGQADPEMIKENIYQLVRRGYTPLFAHPERCSFLAPPAAAGLIEKVWGRVSTQNPKLKTQNELEILKEMGCLFQGNLGSLAGYYGQKVQTVARQFLEMGIYHYFGSDGHAPKAMERYLAAGLEVFRRDLGRDVPVQCSMFNVQS